MTTEEVLYFYHYTSITAAKEIIMKGEIRPSEAACGDAAFGDGVYLTTLKPDLGITTIMNNNWGGAARDKKVEAYFELLMPASNFFFLNSSLSYAIKVNQQEIVPTSPQARTKLLQKLL